MRIELDTEVTVSCYIIKVCYIMMLSAGFVKRNYVIWYALGGTLIFKILFKYKHTCLLRHISIKLDRQALQTRRKTLLYNNWLCTTVYLRYDIKLYLVVRLKFLTNDEGVTSHFPEVKNYGLSISLRECLKWYWPTSTHGILKHWHCN